MKKETKTIKAWAIMPSFPDNKKLTAFPFLDNDRCFLIFITKMWAEKANSNMDERVVPVAIKILK